MHQFIADDAACKRRMPWCPVEAVPGCMYPRALLVNKSTRRNRLECTGAFGMAKGRKSGAWGDVAKAVSARMSKVRSTGTEPERRVVELLQQQGLNPDLHVSDLPGRPDIVFQNQRIAVFVHGCFWHGHAGCRRAALPQNNREMWVAKIQANIRRDRRVSRALRSAGWSVLTIWECQRSEKDACNFLGRLRRKM
jgi:DNA mismatch endonuclease (patch repair protein)